MRRVWTKSEAELAKRVVAWLQDLKWDVYQEVQIHTQGTCADIVAVQGRLIWVIETKLSFGLTVMEQAYRWRGWCHMVSIAVPIRPCGKGFAEHSLKAAGIGVLLVRESEVMEDIPPVLHRRMAGVEWMRKGLNEAQKTFAAAGNPKGLRWTPFQQTCLNIQKAVTANPGISVKDLLADDKFTTHYHSTKTARSCIVRWASKGIIKGVRAERDGRAIRLYPEASR